MKPKKNFFFSQPEPLPKVEVFQTEPIRVQPENWSSEIEELETYFEGIEFPNEPMRLNDHTQINDYRGFLEKSFSFIKGNENKEVFEPYLYRLRLLRKAVSSL